MRNSHTDILYHYTKSLDHVFSILKEGFKVSYSAEQITDNIFIAIPMISFCDIHITFQVNYILKCAQAYLAEDFPDIPLILEFPVFV